MIDGKTIVITAPSGAGKTTIVNYLMGEIPNLGFSISACTRPKREGEVDGQHYYFLSRKEFLKKVDGNAFVEWEEVYENMFYGTLRSEVTRLWADNKVVVFDIDVQGALNLKTEFSENCLSMFIKPPSVEVLAERLRARNTETEASLEKRVRKASWELGFADKFDVVIENRELEVAKKEALENVKTFIKQPILE